LTSWATTNFLERIQIARYWSNSNRTDPSRSSALRCEDHKFTDPVWNKKELPELWKESIIVGVHKKD